MMNNKIDPAALAELREILGADQVITDRELVDSYLFDEVEKAYRPPAAANCVVLKPASTAEISRIMALANARDLPVVVRGGGTGLCGGCTPTQESLIISTERMDRILEIDRENMVAVLECGVTLMQLLEELEHQSGLSFPVHPGDEGAQMGGMAVTNASGARAVRHGAMRKHIMGLTVVLVDGTVLELGGKLVKNNAGYNLAQLIMGSEGTLAIVTQVILRLYPRDNSTATLVAPFPTLEDACGAVREVLQSGSLPLAIEYMDKSLFVGTARMLGLEWQAKEGAADVLFILSEKNDSLLFAACAEINEICRRHHGFELLFAGKKREQDELLLVRSQHYEYIKHSICDSFDMAVPVSCIPQFISSLKSLAREYGTDTNIVAHIADGNVHNDILYVDGHTPAYAEELKLRMYQACFDLGGTITGEHGVGKIRVEDLRLQKPAAELELMRGIKQVFDPKGLLNPGTVVPAD